MKYLATVSYFGERYHGFERQPRLRTIQGVIEKELSRLCAENVFIKAAGRTDAGVNALDQKFSFSCKEIKDLEKWRYALNRLLPEDIHIERVAAVADSFDARHSVIGKQYVYKLSYGERSPFDKGLITQLERKSFDPKAYKEALSVFVGTHDFSNFTTKPEDKDGFIRTISSIEVEIDEIGKRVSARFKGTHFMTYQIRMMVGAAIKAGLGKLSKQEIKGMLEAKPRRIVSTKAPAAGLYLEKVEYGEI